MNAVVGLEAARGVAEPVGVLVIDKPAGPSSFDVVRQVRRVLRTRKVGHGGTLDPMATGVLPICLGEATKLAQFLLDADKEYEASVCFGAETDTYDAMGTVTQQRGITGLTPAAVDEALAQFRGPIRQVPPRFSALKLRGRPLYDYARAGEEVEPAPRTVVVHELTLVSWTDERTAVLRVRCSKGTYIRSLAFDLGRSVGAGAHLTALRRTRSGPFRLDAASSPDQIATAPLIALSEALAHLPLLRADDVVTRQLERGQRVAFAALSPADATTTPMTDAMTGPMTGPMTDAMTGPMTDAMTGPMTDTMTGRFQIVRTDGTLLAVAELADDATLRTLRVFMRVFN